MAKRIPFSIVTPERLAWEGEVDSLVVPAQEGSLGILPGHAPLLAQLRPGMVVIRREGEEPRLLSVSGGFVEVCAGRVSVFAETAEMSDEIDAERARQSLEKAKAALKHGSDEKRDAAAVAALERALARLHAYEAASRYRNPRSNAPNKKSF
ncbi:MAG: ATP synthase F1 subunit epsilon [Elusimicrobia bacterium]|nr:ATP synthase F1 subunit epsilon [Elusimicrobiota bacterium]